MVCFRNNFNGFVVYGFDPEFFYQLNGYHSSNDRRTDYSLHVDALQPEHFLYPEPRYHFSLDNNDPEQHASDQKFDI